MKGKSILNEEYTQKMKELQFHIKQANEIYKSLPDCIKVADKNDIRGHLASSNNSINQLAWSFGIDIDD